MTWKDFGRYLTQAHKAERKTYEEHIETIRRDLRSKEVEPTAAQKLFASSPQTRFFLFVSVPCWLEYRVSPGVLFDEARRGDFDSMCKLLSLDPECLEDVRIRQEHTRLIQTSNDVRRKMLVTATALQPLKKLRRIQIKFLLAAYVLKTWETLDAKCAELQKWAWKREITWIKIRRFSLSYPNLKALFDAAYADTHGGEGEDPDFAKLHPDAFRKRVYRHLSYLPELA